MHSLRTFIILISTLLVLTACGDSPSNVNNSDIDTPHSFAGETINVVIGLDASAGGTTVGRLLAKHLEQNLEGNPTVVVNNMPGASGLNAHLHVLLKAPKDGTTIYYGPRSSLGELLQLPGYTFKYTDFTSLGGIQISGLVVYARTDSFTEPLTNAQDAIAQTEPLLFGGMPSNHGRMIISTLGLDLMGINYRYIPGYPSSGNIRAAVISGEVNTGTDAAHAYLSQVEPVLVETGEATPLFSLPMLNNQGELVSNELVSNIPSLPQLYKDVHGQEPSGIKWDAITTMLELDQTMQHVFLGPPGMDQAAAETLREGLTKATQSAAYETEAEQILSYVPGHIDHQRQHEILGATASVSPDVLEYIQANIDKNSGL